jgi:hypothetical protein
MKKTIIRCCNYTYKYMIAPQSTISFPNIAQERSRLLRILFSPLFWISISFIIFIAFILSFLSFEYTWAAFAVLLGLLALMSRSNR